MSIRHNTYSPGGANPVSGTETPVAARAEDCGSVIRPPRTAGDSYRSRAVSVASTRPARHYSSAAESVSIDGAAINRAVGNGTNKRCGIERLIG